MQLEALTFADWVIEELFGYHEVNDVLDVGDSDGTLSDVGCDDDLSLALHESCIPEGSILLFLAQ